MQYRECYEFGVDRLVAAQVPEAQLDARLLLESVCGTNRNDLLVHGDREVADDKTLEYKEKIALRAKRIPLQHIIGVQEFMGLEFKVNEHVLIPRQDTEILVENALKVLRPGMQILDMCTGSGCILISLLAMMNGCAGQAKRQGTEVGRKTDMCHGTGVDLSEKALAVARENGQRLLGQSVSWLQSDLFDKVTGCFDVIVSNPPYIPTKVVIGLMPEVKDHEPMMALDGMEDGLFFYKKIIAQASQFLREDGYLFFEIGHDQGQAVAGLLEDNNFTEVKVIQDYAGLDRVVQGKRKE